MKRISYYLVLTILSLSLFNCESENFIEFESTKQEKYKTVEVNEAKDFLRSKQNDGFLEEKTNNIELTYNTELLDYETINYSDELLAIVPATTKYENINSRILLLNVDGSLKAVLFNLIPSNQSSETLFSGRVTITDLEGNIRGAYEVVGGMLVAQYVKKGASKTGVNSKNDCDEGYNTMDIYCIEYLEVVEINATNTGGNEFSFSDGFWGDGNINIGSSGDESSDESWDFGGDGSSDSNTEEETAWPFPHCSSFEYFKPPSAGVRACAVVGLNETFYAEGEENGVPGSFDVTVSYPLTFFTMPSWRTNGASATLTAIAVNTAFNRTAEWFIVNPEASEDAVGNKLDYYIALEMSYFGGTFSGIPPYPILNAAPFQTSILNTGNCN